MQCKLYVFEKTAQSWIERGRGLLRLNDMASTDDGTLQSRLGEHTCINILAVKKESNVLLGMLDVFYGLVISAWFECLCFMVG